MMFTDSEQDEFVDLIDELPSMYYGDWGTTEDLVNWTRRFAELVSLHNSRCDDNERVEGFLVEEGADKAVIRQ